MRAKRIGITQRVQDLPEFNERRDCLDQAWCTLLEGAGFVPIPLPNLTTDAAGYIHSLELAGVVLTGGNDLHHLTGATNTAPERDAFETAVVAACARTGLPVLGVCRGMQLLLHLDGVEPVPVDNHVGAEHVVSRVDCRFLGLPNEFATNSFHGYGFYADALKSYRIAARCADDSIEAVEHVKHRIAGIMWHPERSPVNALSSQVLARTFA